MKTFFILLQILFIVSKAYNSYAQDPKLKKILSNISSSNLDIVTIKGKSYVYFYRQNEGYIINGLADTTKKYIIAKEYFPRSDKDNTYMIDFKLLGVVNNKAFFTTGIELANGKGKGDMWSFDGERVEYITISNEVRSILGEGLLLIGQGSGTYQTEDIIFMGDRVHFDGKNFKINNFPNTIALSGLTYRNIIIGSDEPDEKGIYHYYSYNGNELKQLTTQTSYVELFKACSNLFIVEQKFIDNCDRSCEYTVINAYGSPESLDTRKLNKYVIKESIMTFGDKLIFFMRNPAIEKNDTTSGLYITDGTPNGTQLISRATIEDVATWTYQDKKLYFAVKYPDAKLFRIWETDGTKKGTKILKEIKNAESIEEMNYAKGKLVYRRFRTFVYLDNGIEKAMSIELKNKNRFKIAPDGIAYFLGAQGSLFSFDINPANKQIKSSDCNFLEKNPIEKPIKIKTETNQEASPNVGYIGGANISTREGAYQGTIKFKRGTVGYNVNVSIGGIKFALKDYGQAKIGELFNRPDVQALLAKESTPENNYEVAKLEYDYWMGIINDPSQSIENKLGGFLGIFFTPSEREYLQLKLPYAVDSFVDQRLPKIKDDKEQLNLLAQFRVKFLEKIYPKKSVRKTTR